MLTTKIVRPGHITEQGPDMTESVAGHCLTTFDEGSVISTGGRWKSPGDGSARTEVHSFTSMSMRRHASEKIRPQLCPGLAGSPA